jgi:hypothetical protein
MKRPSRQHGKHAPTALLAALLAPTALLAPLLAASAHAQTPGPAPAAQPTTPNKPATESSAAAATNTSATNTTNATEPYEGEPTSPEAIDAERKKLWNSPEMLEARNYVMEYGRRSRQFNAKAAERYLANLSQFSPEQMEAWLKRYQARRANLRQGEQAQQAARELAVRHALDRLQTVQDGYDAFNQGQNEGANIARDQLVARQQFSERMALARQAGRDAQLTQMYTPAYQWLVYPPLWYKEQMAAASLPGDLPAGDPRNFIRGDVPPPDNAHAGPNTGPPGGGGPNSGPPGPGGATGGPNAGPGGGP